MAYVTNLPVNGTFNVTATFGQKGTYWKNGHRGIDITAARRTLYPICSGEVTVVGYDKNGWGRYVSIKPIGFPRIRFITCHMVENSVKVEKGQLVSRVTKIGTMGTSGNSTGVHVHVEMRIDNKSVDPTPYMLIANRKAKGLNSSDYKFDADCQKAALTAMLYAFDRNEKAPDMDDVCDPKPECDYEEYLKVKSQLAQTKAELVKAETKIRNARKELE